MRPFLLLITVAILLAACAHSPEPGPVAFAPGRISQINIITAPVGLNLDGKPGADGFSVKVYANDNRNPKTVPITSGRLEILMFNGTFFGRTNVASPTCIWKFEDLADYQGTSTIGPGYEFLLRWETNRPTERLITVVARYTSPEGEIVVSPASSVTMLEK